MQNAPPPPPTIFSAPVFIILEGMYEKETFEDVSSRLPIGLVDSESIDIISQHEYDFKHIKI